VTQDLRYLEICSNEPIKVDFHRTLRFQFFNLLK